jgi:hypothetical protein
VTCPGAEPAPQPGPAAAPWDATLTLDPDALPDPLAAPGPRDVLVCGASRSGTTLLSAMLFQPPACVCVMEPWDALRLAPAQLFASLRAELRGRALRSGHLDVAALKARGEVVTCTQREAHVPVECDDDVLLAVKCPVLWRYLDRLPSTRFLVCVRDPREVVASCLRSPGRLAEGLDYDVPFNRGLNRHLLEATGDAAIRRVLLYDYVYERILPHLSRPEVLVVRYERWFTEPHVLLAELGAFLETDLSHPLAHVRSPRNRAAQPLQDDVATLVRRHCLTAGLLGYPETR